jgi:hypothetical protein
MKEKEEIAKDIASQLFPLDGTQRRDTLAQLRQEDSELYDLVKGYLASFTPGANN